MIEYVSYASWGIASFLLFKTFINLITGEVGMNTGSYGRWSVSRKDKEPFSYWFGIILQILGACISIYAGFVIKAKLPEQLKNYNF